VRYVLTGPESSGKSTLFDRLSPIFLGEAIPEFARIFAEGKIEGTPFSLDEVLSIATQQGVELVAPGVKLMDTDLLTTLIWLEEKFDYHDSILWEQLTLAKPAYYFICSPDIPWVYDPLRENPYDRDRLFEKYLLYIQRLGFDFQILSGSIAERLSQIQQGIVGRVFLWENDASDPDHWDSDRLSGDSLAT